MSNSHDNIIKLAKQGDPRAISTLINKRLQPKGITAEASTKDCCLQIILRSAKLPEQQPLFEFIHKGILNLEITGIERVRVYGHSTTSNQPSWQQDFDIKPKKLNQEKQFCKNLDTVQECDDTIRSSSRQLGGLLTPASKKSLRGKSFTTDKSKLKFAGFSNRRNLWIFLGISTLLISSLLVYWRFGQGITTSNSSSSSSGVSAPQPKSGYEIAEQKAFNAVVLSQMARTEENWKIITELWQETIELIKLVPRSDENYSLAQQKLVEYQKRLSNAELNETQIALKQANQSKQEQQIENLKQQIEEAVEQQDLIRSQSGTTLSELDAERQASAMRRKEIQIKKDLLQVNKAYRDGIRKAIGDEDIRMMDFEIAEQKRILAGGKPQSKIPIPSSDLNQEAKAALEEYLEFNSRLEVGVTYEDYMRKVGELKAILERLKSAQSLLSHPFIFKLETAQNRYESALQAWRNCVAPDDFLCLNKDYSLEWGSAKNWLVSAKKDLEI